MLRVRTKRYAFLAVLFASTLPALAAEGRIPIPFASPFTTPISITASGKYILTKSLSATGPGPVIEIAPPAGISLAVDIDLNGFVLTGSDGFPVISVLGGGSGAGKNRVRVTGGGTLVGGTTGVLVAPSTTEVAVLEDLNVTVTSSFGIHLTGVPVFAIRRTIVTRTGANGIAVDGMSLVSPGAKEGTIEGNQLRECAGGILVIDGSSVAILNNRVELVGAAAAPAEPGGIHIHRVDSCLVSNNTIEHVFDTGDSANGITVHDSHGCKFYNNTIRDVGFVFSGSGRHGILLDSGSFDNLVLHNVIIEAGGDGIHIEGLPLPPFPRPATDRGNAHHIDQNLLNTNKGYGLHFLLGARDNNYGRNTAVGNGASMTDCPHPLGLPNKDFCDENLKAGLPPLNFSFGDNLMPGKLGLF